jgi:transcriptional regulator with XRE-family HTH domain
VGENKFAKRLKETLLGRKYTHLSFANKIGTTQATVTRWCSGKHEPNFDTLIIIAETLGESTDWFLGLVD